MPAKIESCVKQVMEEQRISEQRAFAICTSAIKAADQGLLFDAGSAFAPKIDPITGFLTAQVNLARTGVQQYMGFELGLSGDESLKKIGVLRPAAEVFHPDSVKSFVNLVVTDDHPSEHVTVDNVKALQRGQVSEVSAEDNLLKGVVTITDKEQIRKIKSGKVEVSVGYSNTLKDEKGVFDGVDYDFIQTKIRANHLAIVDAGRCGPSCRITTTDHNKKENTTMITITIDGIQYQTENAQLAQAIEKMQAARDAEFKKFEKKVKEGEEEKEKLKKEKDKVEATKDALQKEQLSDEALNALVSTRAKILTQATSILGDKMPECTDCAKELKTAVIDHVLPDMELDGKSDDYIDAAYDMAIKKAEKTADSLKKLEGDFLKDKEGNTITRETARAKYMTDQLGVSGE